MLWDVPKNSRANHPPCSPPCSEGPQGSLMAVRVRCFSSDAAPEAGHKAKLLSSLWGVWEVGNTRSSLWPRKILPVRWYLLLTPRTGSQDWDASYLYCCAVGLYKMLHIHHSFLLQHIHKFLNETWSSRYHKELNPNLLTFLWSVIASIFSLGGLCGALIGGSMAIRLGRSVAAAGIQKHVCFSYLPPEMESK